MGTDAYTGIGSPRETLGAKPAVEARFTTGAIVRLVRAYGPATALYLLATSFTNAAFMADTEDYALSVVNSTGLNEFGHLFWRPLGWLFYQLIGARLEHTFGWEPQTAATAFLIAINWIAGFAAVIFFAALVRRFVDRGWAVNVAVAGFVLSHGILNFSQTGTSYVPGLSFLLLGLLLLIRRAQGEGPRYGGAIAGAALAASVCFWFPYLLALPAALASPFFLAGWDRRRLRLVAQATLACGAFGTLSYLVAISLLGIHSIAELQAWVSASSHGTHISGVARAVFGLARSLVNMGADGQLFKRYLVHDPFNPVSLGELFRLSLGQVMLVYLGLGSIVVSLWRSRSNRGLVLLLLLNAGPVFLFGIFFDGGAIERYLPLYPMLFISLAASLVCKGSKVFKAAPLALLALIAVANISAMNTPGLERQAAASTARVEPLRPLLTINSSVVVLHWQDDLMSLHRNSLFDPLVRSKALHLRHLLTPGTDDVLSWKSSFAAHALAVWNKGGDLWLTNRALSERPLPGWGWVEGDDRNVSWSDFPSFFSRMEMGGEAGGDDGFRLVIPSRGNRELLGQVLKDRSL